MASLFIGLAFLASSPKALDADQESILWIETASGAKEFTVEIARTRKEQQRGLMHRRDLAQDAGMLFPFREERHASFFMKNTYIPLDIIFLASNGTIVRIAERTEPLTTISHHSPGKVAAVLEINGGLSDELGIRVGDVVHHQFFGNLEICRIDDQGCP